VHLRVRQPLGPVGIGARLGVPSSTVHARPTRCHLQRLTTIDQVTGEPARRYEHPHPTAMLHVDVRKLGNIPDGGLAQRRTRPGRTQPGRHRRLGKLTPVEFELAFTRQAATAA
jgi:hypothetical protein